jgi:hypothetical protein
MQKGLTLFGMTRRIAGAAIVLDLRDVADHLFPATDLTRIILVATTHVIAAIPLEPAARIIRMDPTFGSPDG